MSRKRKKINLRKQDLKKNGHPEAKGFIYIAFGFLYALALYSFVYGDVHSNYLGIIGYSAAWTSMSIFGLASYFIPLFIISFGWKNLTKTPVINIKRKFSFFFLFLMSSSILLTIIAEENIHIATFFSNNIFTSKIFSSDPSPQFYDRYNLGGIPFYYLYKDIPFINLKKMLSNIGIILIFSTLTVVSFLLFSNIHIIPKTKQIASFIRLAGRKTTQIFFFLLKELFTREKKTKALETINSTINLSNIDGENENTYDLKRKNKNIKEKNIDDISTKVIIAKKTNINALAQNLKFKTKMFSYNLPSPSLLTSPPPVNTPFLKKELGKQAIVLEETLKSFGIKAKVGEINCGPTITSFEVHPDIGVKVQRIKALEKDIALNLQAKSIRIIAPIPGKAAVGVEVPSLHPQPVSLKEMLLYYHQVKRRHSIPLLLGKTVSGDHVIADLTKTPHLLIAGATGSGKSVCINTIVMSILMNSHPDDVKLIMIDPKKVELTQYSKLPHMIAPVITEAHGAYAALQWLVREMQKRYEILKQLGLRNITAFNSRKTKKEFEEALDIDIPEKMSLIVAIVDEFADLMMVSSADLETPIARIAQMARAVGIHLILATQRPSREVITGIIKANFPSRISFKVASRINSQIILDEPGAETLLGNGDLLFLPPGSSHLIRAQGAFISDEDINKVINYLCARYPPSYLIPSFDSMKATDSLFGGDNAPKDKLYDQALSIVINSRNASTTYLQRKLKIGYARAASLMDELEDNNIIGPQEGSKPRRIINDTN